MKTIEIYYIEFDDMGDAMKNDNYPNSGLFVSTVKKGGSDLRFIDKSVESNFCIAPESVFNRAVKIKTSEEIHLEENKFDGDFILEFSRILLNRK